MPGWSVAKQRSLRVWTRVGWQPGLDWCKQQFHAGNREVSWNETWVPSHASFSAKKVHLFIYSDFPPATSALLICELSRQAWDTDILDPCFSACPANNAEEECVRFQDGDLLLLVPLKAALWKWVPIKNNDFRRPVLKAVLFYPTHHFSSWKCNVSVSRL